MSVRLNVVMSQSAGASPRQRDLESEMVARLIAAAGIDLSLIGSVDALDAAATDRLMLEGLRSDMALLSWFSPELAAECLATAGIDGCRAPHPLDPEPASVSQFRRIYHFDLNMHRSAASLQSAIEELLAARRVVTFNLGVSAEPMPSDAAGGEASSGDQPARVPTAPIPPHEADTSQPAEASQPIRMAAGESAEPGDAATGDRPAVPLDATAGRRPSDVASPKRRAAAREADPDAWDALVDELNDSDI